jgi:hypothetical protein
MSVKAIGVVGIGPAPALFVMAIIPRGVSVLLVNTPRDGGLSMTIDDAIPERPLSRREQFNSWFWLAIARHLPRDLIYACAVVLGSHANTGRFQDDPNLPLLEAYRRWWQPNS